MLKLIILSLLVGAILGSNIRIMLTPAAPHPITPPPKQEVTTNTITLGEGLNSGVFPLGYTYVFCVREFVRRGGLVGD